MDKTANYIKDVIGMDGGKHQVTSQSGLNGYLGCLRITDFSYHDLVRVVTKDRSQTLCEREPFLFIDRNLQNTAKHIFDRILDRDDFIFAGLYLRQGCIQGRGFARTCRTGYQYHAVWFPDLLAQTFDFTLTDAEIFKRKTLHIVRNAFLVEDTYNCVLTKRTRHDGHTEVNRFGTEPDFKTAILWYASFRDIQFAHDLETGDDRGLEMHVDRLVGHVENTVDAVFDNDSVVAAFDMNITGTTIKRIQQGRIDQLDYRTGVIGKSFD